MSILFHFDIDAFFASVEVLLNPSLKGRPVIVGGSTQRGVVSTASYEARKYGVHSAMSTHMARQLCPNGIFLDGNFNAYRDYSKQVFKVMYSCTPHIEKVGIDEGYLDVSQLILQSNRDSLDQAHVQKKAMDLAQKLKDQVKESTGLTISIGISYNKFLAKLASDWKKPDGLFVIPQGEAQDLLDPLPILKVHGLGKKTAQKLNRLGLFTVKDIRLLGEVNLGYLIGDTWARDLYPKLCGIDPRPIVTYYERKSYGRETTFSSDTTDLNLLKGVLSDFLTEIHASLMQKHLLAKTLTIKVKYYDFTQHTHSHSLASATDDLGFLKSTLEEVLLQIDLESPVRLIGISLSNLSGSSEKQLSIFDHL